jgi:hypothetical protein
MGKVTTIFELAQSYMFMHIAIDADMPLNPPITCFDQAWSSSLCLHNLQKEIIKFK